MSKENLKEGNGIAIGEDEKVYTPEIKRKRGGAGRGQGRKRVEDRKRQIRVSIKGSKIDSLGGDQVLSNKLEGMVENMYQNKTQGG